MVKMDIQGYKTKLRRRVTISISHETHRKLSQLRKNGESIDDAILRVLNEAVKRPDIST
jgi:predicted CopG family antitoxin